MTATLSAPALRVPDDEREVRAMLLRAVEPANRAVLKLVEQAGVHDTLDAILRGFAIGDLDVGGMRARLTSPDIGALDLQGAAAVGARLVIPSDPEWPRRLRDLDRVKAGSLGVYVRGRLPDLDAYVNRSVAVVGTRAATAYGEEVAQELSIALAESGWAVVSGLAYGIDAAAHRGALAAVDGAGTIAVLACGIDMVYPRAHTALLRRILDAGGGIVSEHPPGTAPYRARFLVRNRLIAGLSRGTVVVEAAARSGARSTAKYAGTLGRAVMAVPGPITAATSAGCHQLLRDDPAVALVTSLGDVVEMVGEMGDLAARVQGPAGARDRLSAMDAAVVDAVPVRRGAPLEKIAVAAGISPGRLVDVLHRLAAGGMVEPDGDGWRLSPAAAGERRARNKGQDPLELDWWW